jgi:hypothetical protein
MVCLSVGELDAKVLAGSLFVPLAEPTGKIKVGTGFGSELEAFRTTTLPGWSRRAH